MMKKRIVSGVLAVLTVFAYTGVNAGVVHGGGDTCFSTVNKHGVSISANAEEEQISKDHFKYIEETETVVDEKTGVETPVTVIRITGYDLEGASGYSKFEAIKEGKKTIGYKMVLPSEINGIPVTAIGDSAFEDYSQLIAVEIPDSVKMIDSEAFHNTSLTEIDIPENVKTIEKHAFYFDRKDENDNPLDAPLTKVTLHNGLERIGDNAFYGSAITSIDIPYTLTEGSEAFLGCDKLAQVNFLTDENGNAMQKIPESLLEGCKSLTAIELPTKGLEVIDSWAFHNTGLTEIDIPENVKTIEYKAFGFDRQEDEEGNRLDAPLTKVTLHNGLERIVDNAFYGSAITSIDIPYTLTEGSGAFSECDKLAQVNFLTDENGNAMQKIPDSLLEGCKSLTAIELPAKGLKEIGSWAFHNTGLTEIDIPGNVKTIGYKAFEYDADAENKSPLTKITLNEGLVSIGEGAFANAQITELHIPSTLWECGSSPFGQCYQLKKVTFADQLFKIPEHLLENCTALEEVELSEKVDTIGQSAFAGCNSLTKVVIPDAYCRIDSWAFENTDCVVYSTVDADAEEGAQTVQNYTAENNVKFESLGDYTQPDPYYGDLNKDGSVDIVDVLIVNKAVLGVEHVTWQQTERGDVDKGDNGERMDSTDSLNILKYIVKIIEDFSALVK